MGPNPTFTPRDSWPPGTVIKDDYVIEARIGKGGFGTVYKAKHRFLQSEHVIKRLHEEYSSDEEYVRKFIAEGQVIRRLKESPYIVAVEHMTLTADQHLILIMEFMPGGDLNKLMEARRFFTVPEVAGYTVQIAEGLRAAHAIDLIHRDVKPHNVLLAENKRKAKLTDFGIAADHQNSKATSVVRGGSLGFAAPEQWTTSGRNLDGRTDIYSLGVTMYLMLTQCMPYAAGDIGGWIDAVRTTQPIAANKLREDIPEDINRLVMQMIEVRREHRPADVDAVIEALRPYANASDWSQSASLRVPDKTIMAPREGSTPSSTPSSMPWSNPSGGSDSSSAQSMQAQTPAPPPPPPPNVMTAPPPPPPYVSQAMATPAPPPPPSYQPTGEHRSAGYTPTQYQPVNSAQFAGLPPTIEPPPQQQFAPPPPHQYPPTPQQQFTGSLPQYNQLPAQPQMTQQPVGYGPPQQQQPPPFQQPWTPQAPPPQQIQKSGGGAGKWLVIIPLVLGLLGGGGWYGWKLYHPETTISGGGNDDPGAGKTSGGSTEGKTDWIAKGDEYQKTGDYHKALECFRKDSSGAARIMGVQSAVEDKVSKDVDNFSNFGQYDKATAEVDEWLREFPASQKLLDLKGVITRRQANQ